MAGVNYEANPATGKHNDQTMILIDRKKYLALTESEMFRPTWDNMIDLSMRFVKDIKGTEPERLARIKAVMNDDYVGTYASVFESSPKLNLWDSDQRAMALTKVFGSDANAKDTWKIDF